MLPCDESLILQLNEVCESDLVSESRPFSPSSCTSYDSYLTCPSSPTHVKELGLDVQGDADEQDSPSYTTLPDISAAREVTAYNRNRHRVRETTKLTASRQRQQAARLQERVKPPSPRRKEKGAWGVSRVMNRSDVALLLEDAMEVLDDERSSAVASWSWQDYPDTIVFAVSEVFVSPLEDWRGGSFAYPVVNDGSKYSRGDDAYSYPSPETDSDLESSVDMEQQFTAAAPHDSDRGINHSLYSISEARETRAYEYNRRRVKDKANFTIHRSKKQDRSKRSYNPKTRKATGRKRRQIRVVDPGDDVSVQDDFDEESYTPLEVSLTSIVSEEPSGRPFYVSDLPYTEEKVRMGKEPGFEFVAQVPAVIALDDEPSRDLDIDDPWEHVWNDDLLDGQLL